MPEYSITAAPARQLTAPAKQELRVNGALERDLSFSAHEVMGRAPPWILRSGVTALASALLLVLFLSWFIKYPETIQGRIAITGNAPAVPLVAKQSGNLERLEVAEGDTVHGGQLMGIIKNPANSSQVLALKSEIEKLQPFLADPTRFVPLKLDPDVQLGPVQNAYCDFATSYRNYEALLSDVYAERTMEIVKSQLSSKKFQLETAIKQSDALSRESELSMEALERMRRLYSKDAVSRAELQNQERASLEQSRQVSTLAKVVMEDRISINDYEKQINELAHQREEGLRTGRMGLSEAWKKLMASVEAWESDYVLRSPVEGRVGFYDFWREQQYVTAGKTVMIVVPSVSTLVGRMPTKERGVGKIVPGQRVFIKLDDYPAREFGMIAGEVQSVSLVVQQGEQLVSVKVPHPLKTHLGKEVPFKQEMTGEASVVTQDYRLIERVFQSFVSVIKGSPEAKPAAPATAAGGNPNAPAPAPAP
ncbi:MAG TPA: HlyD family efflux transporter periplasmic adaptor subunit [Candidatus Saccharimonadia bacterium]|nr:HlyD family efflux transporter periplasmic adaptor subunit [Candidatus Saccharimonadia bacterium]